MFNRILFQWLLFVWFGAVVASTCESIGQPMSGSLILAGILTYFVAVLPMHVIAWRFGR